MNTTKLLCKHLDIEEKGYVNGADIMFFIIVITIVSILLISMFGSFGVIYFNGVDAPIPTFTEMYTLLNIGVGFVMFFIVILLIYTTLLILKTFFKHKFVICERNIENKIKMESKMKVELLECNECGVREWTHLDEHKSQDGDGCMVVNCNGVYIKMFEVENNAK